MVVQIVEMYASDHRLEDLQWSTRHIALQMRNELAVSSCIGIVHTYCNIRIILNSFFSPRQHLFQLLYVYLS